MTPTDRGAWRFAAIFFIVVVGLFVAELSLPVQQAIVNPFTESLATTSAALVRLFDANVLAYGRILQSTSNGFAISIEAGCNGVEAGILLIGAVAAFKAPVGYKAIGLAAGLASVQVLNVVRIVTLFYLGQWSLAAFQWAHLYVWQSLIMLDVLIVWLLWLRWLPKPPSPPRAALAG